MYILTRKVKIYLFFMHTCMSLSVSCGLSVDRGTLRSSNCPVLAIWKCLRLRAPFSVWPECSLAVAPAQSPSAPGDTPCSWLLASRCYSCCCRLPSCQGDGCTGVLSSSSWFSRCAPGFAHIVYTVLAIELHLLDVHSHIVSIRLKSLGSACVLAQLTEAGCLQSKQLRFLLALLPWMHLHLAVGCKYTTNKRVWCRYTNNFCSAIQIRVPKSPR